jgi:hypothetical protein
LFRLCVLKGINAVQTQSGFTEMAHAGVQKSRGSS